MIWTHRTVLEGDADTLVSRDLRDGLPKLDKARKKLFERFVNLIISFWIGFELDYGAGKAGNHRHTNVGRHVYRPQECDPSVLRLFRVERIFVQRADGGNAE